MIEPYRKHIDYCFSDCEHGDIEFIITEREGKIRGIHFKSGKLNQDFRKGNITEVENIRKFTDWIAECIESTVSEYNDK